MKKKCWCGKDSIRGVKNPLCQYHYNCYMFGKTWADKCIIDKLEADNKNSK